MGDVQIVPLAEAHIPALVHLELVCFSEPWSESSLRRELSNPLAHVFVAEVDGETAGYAGMHCVVDECYVNNVAVFPQYRRRGIGYALVQRLLEQGERLRARFLTLEVRASNQDAMALYQRLGFSVQGIRRDFYIMPTEDGVIMTRTLEKGEGEHEVAGD